MYLIKRYKLKKLRIVQQSEPSSNGSVQQGDYADLRQEAKLEPQKVHNENAMNVVVVGAECAPWSKTGQSAVIWLWLLLYSDIDLFVIIRRYYLVLWASTLDTQN